jgi:hypothetical protein
MTHNRSQSIAGIDYIGLEFGAVILKKKEFKNRLKETPES